MAVSSQKLQQHPFKSVLSAACGGFAAWSSLLYIMAAGVDDTLPTGNATRSCLGTHWWWPNDPVNG